MAIQQYKTFVLLVMVVLSFFAASPVLQKFVLDSQTTHLTEFSILGQYHNTTYPVNVASEAEQSLFLGVTNHMGSCVYYQIEVKFRNESQSAPDSFNKTNSALMPTGVIPLFLADNQTAELPITISFQYKTSTAAVTMQKIIINGFPMTANLPTLTWDNKNSGYLGNLFFELWTYNQTANAFQYDQRYVSLWLNFGFS